LTTRQRIWVEHASHRVAQEAPALLLQALELFEAEVG
jgi:hypothetical protein